MSHRPKLLIIGHADHGKDTVCELLRDHHGYTFESSSTAGFEPAVWPMLAGSYDTREQCWADKDNKRSAWFHAIKQYNTPDLTRLAREITGRVDIYNGMRSREEFEPVMAAGIFDFVVWVDASKRRPLEPVKSMELNEHDAHFHINNNGSENALHERVIGVLMAIRATRGKPL